MKQLSQEIINSVHWANKYFPEGRIVFCGSFGLALNGLLNREIKDVDLLTEKNYYMEYGMDGREGNSGEFWMPTDNKNRQVLVKCFKLKSPDNIVIDVLHRLNSKRKEENGFEVEYTEVDFYGEKILVETPQGAITAKKRYLQSDQLQYRDKHIADLEEIEINMRMKEITDIYIGEKNIGSIEDWQVYKDNMIE